MHNIGQSIKSPYRPCVQLSLSSFFPQSTLTYERVFVIQNLPHCSVVYADCWK